MRYDRRVSGHLPFLVVHGAAVWKAIAAIATLGGPLALSARRRRRHRDQIRRDIGLVRAGEAPLAVGNVAITGKLRGGSATTVTQREVATDRRDDAAWLEVDGERVELAAPVRVEAGTRVRAAWWWPRRIAPAGFDVRAMRSTVVHSLRDGDEVFVLGVLEEGATGSAGYRESSRAWTLRGNETGAIVASATSSNELPMPKSPLRHAASGVACALTTVIALWIVGGIAMSRVDPHNFDGFYGLEEPRVASLEWLGPLTIAAATPGHRDDAIAHLHWQISERLAFTHDQVELAAAIEAVVGNCPARSTSARAGSTRRSPRRSAAAGPISRWAS